MDSSQFSISIMDGKGRPSPGNLKRKKERKKPKQN